MLKSWMRDLTLAIQARTGISPAVPVWIFITAVTALTAFAFFCVAAYEWLSQLFGPVFGALIEAGFFVLVALIAAFASAAARSGAKRRALLERAARTPATLRLLDPKMLGVAMQAGRTLGWQRLAAMIALGLLAAQWIFESRERKTDDAGKSS